MKRPLLILAVWIGLPALAWAESNSGTIVVLLYSKDKVIMASDRRVHTGSGRYEDGHCKIFALGDKFIFTASGTTVDYSNKLPEKFRFRADLEARRAITKVREPCQDVDCGNFVEEIAKIWTNTMAARFVQGAPFRLDQWLSRAKGDAFVQGLFAGFDARGELQIAFGRIEIGKPRPGYIVPVARPVVITIGVPDSPLPEMGHLADLKSLRKSKGERLRGLHLNWNIGEQTERRWDRIFLTVSGQ